MRRSDFARLVGVSKQQVSKYEADGAIFVTDGLVDAATSLDALEGRLDEDKRLRALQSLQGLANPVRQAAAPEARGPTVKQEKDAIDRDLRLLEYGQKAGELVVAADVDETARRAVAEMRETFNNARRLMADQICATFGIPADKSGALARFLGVGFEQALGQFAQVMSQLAAPSPVSEALDAEDLEAV